MFAFILILHSFQLIFMDSAVCKESFSFISVFCIFFFIHSRRSYVISAFPIFLHFSFCSFPLYSAFVILFCFSIFLCQHSSFLILLIRISFLFPFSFFLFQNLYIFDRHGCIYLYTWINICFQKFDSFFCFLFLGCQLFQFIFASLCRLFSHPPAVYFRISLPFAVSLPSPPPPCCRQAA